MTAHTHIQSVRGFFAGKGRKDGTYVIHKPGNTCLVGVCLIALLGWLLCCGMEWRGVILRQLMGSVWGMGMGLWRFGGGFLKVGRMDGWEGRLLVRGLDD